MAVTKEVLEKMLKAMDKDGDGQCSKVGRSPRLAPRSQEEEVAQGGGVLTVSSGVCAELGLGEARSGRVERRGQLVDVGAGPGQEPVLEARSDLDHCVCEALREHDVRVEDHRDVGVVAGGRSEQRASQRHLHEVKVEPGVHLQIKRRCHLVVPLAMAAGDRGRVGCFMCSRGRASAAATLGAGCTPVRNKATLPSRPPITRWCPTCAPYQVAVGG